MRLSKFLFTLVLFISPAAWSVEKPTAQKLATAAFKSPAVPFEAKLILTEWKKGETRAEEARLFFAPPNSYRIEFLAFDGSVRKIVLTDEKYAQVGSGKSPLVGGPLNLTSLLSDNEAEGLLLKNYTPEIKGQETFIGRPVWVVHLKPRTDGKPVHELKIDQQTQIVLEQRRYINGTDTGSLTRFSTFEPNKTFSSDIFPISDQIMIKKDGELAAPSFATVPSTPEQFRSLPAGFSLNGHRTFEVEGTTANYFTYTDGALPLSIFKTTLPVRFPTQSSMSDKLSVVSGSGTGLSSADQILYGKHGQDYFTIIGEVSPDLLHTIANHFE